MKSRLWLTYALVTTASWGVWGAFTGVPADHGFPETLIYAVWALTMIPPALYALRRVGWRLQHDARSVCYGALIGLLGAGGLSDFPGDLAVAGGDGGPVDGAPA
jgi:hypothetical protein